MSNKCTIYFGNVKIMHKFVKTLLKIMNKCRINTASVKKQLPYGAIKEIAKRSNKSIFTVSRVLKGRGNNPIVLKNIQQYLEEIKETTDQINALVSEPKIAN